MRRKAAGLLFRRDEDFAGAAQTASGAHLGRMNRFKAARFSRL